MEKMEQTWRAGLEEAHGGWNRQMEELKRECLDNIKEYQRVSRNEPPPSVRRFTEALSSKGKAPVIEEDYEEQEASDSSEVSARSPPRRTSTIRSPQIPPRFKPTLLLRQ